MLYWFCHTSTWIHHACIHVPNLETPSTSLPVPSLWVIPVHQPWASCIMHRTWTDDSFLIWYYTCFNVILPNHSTLSLSHRALWYPLDCSLPGFSIHGILQARILKWVAISFSRPRGRTHISWVSWTGSGFFSTSTPGGSNGKDFTCNAGHLGFIPMSGRSPGGGHGYQYSFLGIPWTEETGRLQSMGSQKSQDTTEQLTLSLSVQCLLGSPRAPRKHE